MYEMIITQIIRVAALTLLLLISGNSIAQDTDNVLQPGSQERRKICEAFADIFVEAHGYIAAGNTIQRYRKELEIELAGNKNGEILLGLSLVGASLAEQYIKEDLSADELRLDFLHPCITTAKDISTVAEELWLEKMPQDHPSRNRMLGLEEDNSLEFEPDGSLSPKVWQDMLGDDFEKMYGVSAIVDREDGQVKLCGYEFSRVNYDYMNSRGKPVKISGSINIATHPINYLMGMLKIKGEDFNYSTLADGSGHIELKVFKIENIYPTMDGTPIVDDFTYIECEDQDYICQANFQWDKLVEAMLASVTGIAYRREGSSTDVEVKLDWLEPDKSAKEVGKFSECVSELAKNAMSKIEETAD